MGSAYDRTSPVKTLAPTLYLEASMDNAQTLGLAAVEALADYVVKGRIRCGGDEIPECHMARLTAGESEPIEAPEPSPPRIDRRCGHGRAI